MVRGGNAHCGRVAIVPCAEGGRVECHAKVMRLQAVDVEPTRLGWAKVGMQKRTEREQQQQARDAHAAKAKGPRGQLHKKIIGPCLLVDAEGPALARVDMERFSLCHDAVKAFYAVKAKRRTKMKTLAQILKEKSGELITVRPNDSVFVALQVLATYNVGALPVVSSEGLVGIFSERDYARKVALKGLKSETTEVQEVMSGHVICAELTATVLECMQLMSDKKIRHLPVKDKSALVGIVSIGDLVKAIIEAQQFQIEQLEQYIKS